MAARGLQSRLRAIWPAARPAEEIAKMTGLLKAEATTGATIATASRTIRVENLPSDGMILTWQIR